jgi:tungstate transport system permease protein
MPAKGLLTAFLTAFGRAIADVGAIIIVAHQTTTIALETSRGDLSLALALGIILLGLWMAVSAASLIVGRGLPER